MATKKRRQFPAEFKVRVEIEAVKGQKTIQEIASPYKVHPHPSTTGKSYLGTDLGPRLCSTEKVEGFRPGGQSMYQWLMAAVRCGHISIPARTHRMLRVENGTRLDFSVC